MQASIRYILFFLFLISTINFHCKVKTELLDGDILFQESNSNQSRAIQLATKSRYSHVAILYIENGHYFVYEAVQPVKLTPLDDWIKNGVNQHFVVKRLKNRNLLLSNTVLRKMKSEGKKFNRKNYDLYFDWSDERIYCSELVWKIYKRAANIEIGKLRKLKEFDLSSNIVSDKLRERYNNNLPLEENVISPADIFNSDLLETVMEKNKPSALF